MTAAASNRAAIVGPRQRELLAEARAMVNGERAMTPNPLHVAALVIALEEAEHQEMALRALTGAREMEILSLQADLRDTQAYLVGFQPADPHVHVRVNWTLNNYIVERRFVREYGVFQSFRDAIDRRDVVRASLQPTSALDAYVTEHSQPTDTTERAAAIGAGD